MFKPKNMNEEEMSVQELAYWERQAELERYYGSIRVAEESAD